MNEAIKWAIGLTLTVVLAVGGAAWLVASEIGKVRTDIAVIDTRLADVDRRVDQPEG
ncbi:MAG: hypothetical protein OXE73_09525 [Gammaproteobacteria bacterium]|nr:hypothetical protein [Gammaproteobacteria bacterium]